MKNLLTLILVFTLPCFCISQDDISQFDECQLLNYIEQLSQNNYSSQPYFELKRDRKKRKDLLLRLEEYVIIFRSEVIGPMFLESTLDRRSCPDFVTAFESLVRKNDNVFRENKKKDIDELREQFQFGPSKKRNILYLLFDLCGLINEEDSQFSDSYISEFKDSYTLEFLYEKYSIQYVDPCLRNGRTEDNSFTCLTRLSFETNLKNLTTRLDILDNKNFSHYESHHSFPNMLKGFELHHDNDVFMLIPGKNQDREYTGGFKFIFITDYFKWRFFKIWNKNVMGYQSISLGGSGYTPYIRYRNNFDLADSIHIHDRPFGSYLYLERAKYRTWRKGLVRQNGGLQIGAIGISQGREIQAKLHEDVIHKSQFVHGWDKQIGDGGRLVFQLNQAVDLLLFSTTNKHQTVFKPKKIIVDKFDDYKYWGHNIFLETDIQWGGFMTSAGVGLRYSTLDFLKQSGTNQILANRNSRFEFGWKFDFGISYKYVQHNTMLEGLGYFKTFPQDNYDKVNQDSYVLRNNQIDRNQIFVDFGINLRWRKSTFYFRQVFHTLGYHSALHDFDFQNNNVLSTIDPNDLDFYNDKVVKEQNSFLNSKVFGKTFYGYGTIGMSWLIE